MFSPPSGVARPIAVVAAIMAAYLPTVHAQDAEETTPSVRVEMAAQAERLHGIVRSEVAYHFLDAVPDLPAIDDTRVLYYNRESRSAITPEEADGMTESERIDYERRELDEEFYYYTMYGSPLAFVRPLDLMGRAGLDSLQGARIVDFGFGSVGQLRLMAANGASAHGIEVSSLLQHLYSHPGDTGRVPRAKAAGVGADGEVVLHFGHWPAEETLVRDVDGGYDVFVSKNTLKNGYIHPAEKVDPRMLVNLEVDDETFVRSVYNALAPEGWFMIYNLCPPQAEDRYIPWADGRCPFTRELLEETGFDVLAYNEDDSATAREMGKMLGWDQSMNLETDLFATYTLVRKR
jgi:hypothetical protein